MKQINDGGTAFPGLNAEFTGIDSDGQERFEIQPSGGLSARDYFAAKALQGIISAPAVWSDCGYTPVNGLSIIDNNALLAYQYADAMIQARKTK